MTSQTLSVELSVVVKMTSQTLSVVFYAFLGMEQSISGSGNKI